MHQNIWFPGVYVPQTQGDYAKKVEDISLAELTELVQTRAQEDGEWCITHDVLDVSEAKMRRMMEFVSRDINIEQCVGHILRERAEGERTVDWVCRDLAKASRVLIQ